MTDKELLELAAHAVGYVVDTNPPDNNGLWLLGDTDPAWWDPLTDDGDALRLAVKLDMLDTPNLEANTYAHIHGDSDPYAATRRAIVRAVAEIGKGMRPFPTVEEIEQFSNTDHLPEFMK